MHLGENEVAFAGLDPWVDAVFPGLTRWDGLRQEHLGMVKTVACPIPRLATTPGAGRSQRDTDPHSGGRRDAGLVCAHAWRFALRFASLAVAECYSAG